MSEPFDPNIHLRPGADGLPTLTTEMDPPSGLTSILTQQRQAFSGLEDLPVDEPPLEGQEVLPTEEPPPPATAIALPIEPAVIAGGQPVADSATAARLAILEAELAALRATPQQAQTYVPATPPVIAEEVYARIADRAQANFASMAEQRADESDQQFEQRRARGFAEMIVAAVYEDLLPSEAVQARFDPRMERVAQQAAQQTTRHDREITEIHQQEQALVVGAVARAREAGYDVYVPSDARHATSVESKLFWDKAQLINPTMPGEQQIATTLSLMPAKAPAATPGPATPLRPQPMARQGQGPVAAPTGQGQDYVPMTMQGMMSQHRQVSRVGG